MSQRVFAAVAALITAVNLNFSDQWFATNNAVENGDSRDWLWEVCCDNDSTLTQAALDRGHRARRPNIATKSDASYVCWLQPYR